MTIIKPEDRKDLTLLVVAVARQNGLMNLSDLCGKNGDTSLTAPRVRELCKQYASLGLEYWPASYRHGNPSNSNFFGRCGTGFGAYRPAAVCLSHTLTNRVLKNLAKRQAR